MRIAVMGYALLFVVAEATNCTGELTVAPLTGDVTVTEPLGGGAGVAKKSDIGVAVAMAPGKVDRPSAAMIVRPRFWCWYRVLDRYASFAFGPITTVGMWPPPCAV